ncbi:hypothetical protein BAUCODRAFT_124025 [Baudoinia panamericana UAMH 10762]|uniref:3-phytase n=1 Tax=Baudoinia panamericana (strain UAMH 10762) TaxID=717646 RepID=M2MCY4_BAUPA|nr:uncharacterized protein BAUCODRAFT_124025 [Baudoinia panamericana UAMH 10762]EMC94391.1 hypothetical protein BAUCODRAFT_124025 [Baudoinia panamericana UAMH 10762]
MGAFGSSRHKGTDRRCHGSDGTSRLSNTKRAVIFTMLVTLAALSAFAVTGTVASPQFWGGHRPPFWGSGPEPSGFWGSPFWGSPFGHGPEWAQGASSSVASTTSGTSSASSSLVVATSSRTSSASVSAATATTSRASSASSSLVTGTSSKASSASAATPISSRASSTASSVVMISTSRAASATSSSAVASSPRASSASSSSAVASSSRGSSALSSSAVTSSSRASSASPSSVAPSSSLRTSSFASSLAVPTPSGTPGVGSTLCDTIGSGYQCQNNISHFWGQYSPYFSVASNISDQLPSGCSITFAQMLSRHGARDPIASKTTSYNNTINKIHANVKNYTAAYAFIANYSYTLGADQLTIFGQQELINSGIKYFDRYATLTSRLSPFVRSAGEARVVESAQNWTQGFDSAKLAAGLSDPTYPYPIVVIPEDAGVNNTLNHDLCNAFENGPDNSIASSAQSKWTAVFIPPIQARLNAGMPGANLTTTDTINMMDLCPFNTVASLTGAISPFCSLFTEAEWHQYNYYETLNKYYGYSYGNPLGPTQGVGFGNELIARMTNQPVHDMSSTNTTLDNNSTTFPLGRQLYADFSHDNDMTAIFSALGLYNGTGPLSNTTVVEAEQANYYSAAYTVPFAARAYFEKMQCTGQSEELVRVIVNDRVLPLTQCGGDNLGRCTLSKFVGSLGFVQSNGLWNQCFVGNYSS